MAARSRSSIGLSRCQSASLPLHFVRLSGSPSPSYWLREAAASTAVKKTPTMVKNGLSLRFKSTLVY
ncbi:Hypothetical predicted protein [Xyrichtys novacula]|uniref:Uncharacterized protein n=1 Tax=Xyrichtys novacula TaxID=13765 RepID=A0AAV1G0Q0_XYRNO|nr:Hypothetical predicted protein [Xyrichtys novacula]